MVRLAVPGGGISDRLWLVVAAATAALTAAAAVMIAYRDPSWWGSGLWLASMVFAVITSVLYDRRSRWWQRIIQAAGWRWIDTTAVVILAMVALVIRIHHLGPTLPFMHGDEGEMGLLARRALNGSAAGARPLPVFGTEFLDHPTLFHYVQAGALAVLGDSITSLRVLSAGIGALAAPAVYLIGRLGWGRVAGLAAGWLLGVSHLHIHYSRVALNNIESASLITVAMVLVFAAVTHGRAASQSHSPTPSLTLFVLFGLTVGVSQYFYYGSRVLVALMLPILLVLRGRRLARTRDIGAAIGATLVAVLPLVLHYLRHPVTFSNRTDRVSVFGRSGLAHELGVGATLPRDLGHLLLTQVRRNIAFFINSGDHSGFYTPTYPAFDRITQVLFWLGIAVVLGSVAFRRGSAAVPSQLILIWIVTGVTLGGILTIDSPNGPRLLMVVPAVFVCGGVSAQYLWNAAHRRWPTHKSALRFTVAALALVTFFANWNRYFVEYARRSQLAALTEIAALIRDQAPSHRVFLIGGDVLRVDNGVVRFITDGGDQSDLASDEAFETQFPSLIAAGRPVLVIALEFRAADLRHIQQLHPGGAFTTYLGADDRPSYFTYELPLTRAALKPIGLHSRGRTTDDCVVGLVHEFDHSLAESAFSRALLFRSQRRRSFA